jgi:hypothetical protein
MLGDMRSAVARPTSSHDRAADLIDRACDLGHDAACPEEEGVRVETRVEAESGDDGAGGDG